MSEYAVVWPRAAKTVEVAEPAPRLPSLEGKKVAFLWDYLFRGDEIFPLLEAQLSARYPTMSFVGYQEFGTTHGEGEHALIEGLGKQLRDLGVDAVVSGMGC
jgi:hypothetical protein